MQLIRTTLFNYFYSIGNLFISACMLPWNFKFSLVLVPQYYYWGGNYGTMCAVFVLGTFRRIQIAVLCVLKCGRYLIGSRVKPL